MTSYQLLMYTVNSGEFEEILTSLVSPPIWEKRIKSFILPHFRQSLSSQNEGLTKEQLREAAILLHEWQQYERGKHK